MQTGTLEAGFSMTLHCHPVLGIDGRLVMLLLENQDIDVNIKNVRPECERWMALSGPAPSFSKLGRRPCVKGYIPAVLPEKCFILGGEIFHHCAGTPRISKQSRAGLLTSSHIS